jgi:tRNA (cmo5U34)-methyltransferase
MVTDRAARFRVPGAAIVDLGASRGDAVAPMIEAGWENSFELVEVSAPMAAVCRERYAERALRPGRFNKQPWVRVHEHDLRTGYPDVGSACVTLCVLTLQFTPIEHRLGILRNIFRHTLPGGAVILVEKVLGSDAEANETLRALYHDLKERTGYSREEIDRKAASLEGVLVPVTARWNEEMLRGAGFQSVECFWRCLSFAGWIAVRT